MNTGSRFSLMGKHSPATAERAIAALRIRSLVEQDAMSNEQDVGYPLQLIGSREVKRHGKFSTTMKNEMSSRSATFWMYGTHGT